LFGLAGRWEEGIATRFKIVLLAGAACWWGLLLGEQTRLGA
jgi:hypothetical protein